MTPAAFQSKVIREDWAILDFLRIFAAILVMLGHARFLYFGSPHDLVHMPKWETGIFFIIGLQHQAVVIFFVISGFLVGGPVVKLIGQLRFDLWTYLINRFTRIYLVLIPALILAFIMDRVGAAALSGTNPHHDLLDGWSDFNLVCHLVSLQGLACLSHADPPLWSLGYEWMLYLVGPLFIAILFSPLGWGARSIALLMLLLTGLAVLPERTQWQFILAWFAGAAVYRWREEIQAPLAVGLAGLPLVLAACIIAAERKAPLFASDGLVVIGLVLIFGCNALMSSTVLNSRFSHFAKPAGFSYSLYAIHLPVVVMCARLLQEFGLIDGNPGVNVSNGVALGISVGVALLAAAGFSRLTEANTGAVRQAIQARRASSRTRGASAAAPPFSREKAERIVPQQVAGVGLEPARAAQDRAKDPTRFRDPGRQ